MDAQTLLLYGLALTALSVIPGPLVAVIATRALCGDGAGSEARKFRTRLIVVLSSPLALICLLALSPRFIPAGLADPRRALGGSAAFCRSPRHWGR